MAASPINAAAAYQAVARLGTGGAGGAESALPNLGTGATGGDFSSFLNDAVKSTVDTMRSRQRRHCAGGERRHGRRTHVGDCSCCARQSHQRLSRHHAHANLTRLACQSAYEFREELLNGTA